VEDALAAFPAREQDIVRKRLLAEDPATLERLGAAWGVSKERVRQIEQATKARMRTRLVRAGAAP
jgi:RNA polymerase sigma-32 factor